MMLQSAPVSFSAVTGARVVPVARTSSRVVCRVVKPVESAAAPATALAGALLFLDTFPTAAAASLSSAKDAITSGASSALDAAKSAGNAASGGISDAANDPSGKLAADTNFAQDFAASNSPNLGDAATAFNSGKNAFQGAAGDAAARAQGQLDSAAGQLQSAADAAPANSPSIALVVVGLAVAAFIAFNVYKKKQN